MVEVKFYVVKPNLQVRDYKSKAGDAVALLYSLEKGDDVSKSARAIDDVVKKYISEKGLRVRESEFKVIKYKKKFEESETYSFPLAEYLDIFDERRNVEGITKKSTELFGLSHNVDASSYESDLELLRWASFKMGLANPNETFDELEEGYLIRYDRARTLDNMKRVFGELDVKIPHQSVGLTIIPARDYVGFICLNKLREEGKEKIDSAKSELVEKLKEFKGPCLSHDAF